MIDELYKPFLEDVPLMRKLGLTMWSGKPEPDSLEIELGVVRPYEVEEEPGLQTQIQVFVTPMPAQFFRFEILRKSERDDSTGMESLSIETGSGTLSKFWPMALAVASNMLSVSTPVPVEIIEAGSPAGRLS